MKTANQLARLQEGTLQSKTKEQVIPELARVLADKAIETTYSHRGLTHINIIFTDTDTYAVWGFDEDDNCYNRKVSGWVFVDGERYSYGEGYEPDGYKSTELLTLVEAVRLEFIKNGYHTSSKVHANRIELKVRWRL